MLCALILQEKLAKIIMKKIKITVLTTQSALINKAQSEKSIAVDTKFTVSTKLLSMVVLY